MDRFEMEEKLVKELSAVSESRYVRTVSVIRDLLLVLRQREIGALLEISQAMISDIRRLKKRPSLEFSKNLERLYIITNNVLDAAASEDTNCKVRAEIAAQYCSDVLGPIRRVRNGKKTNLDSL